MDDPLPNVSDLEDQLAAQQSMIEQMRDTLLQREQTVSSNEKKVQDYAATLSRIRSSHRPNKKKDESKSAMALDVTPQKGPSSKMNLLRKQMEENRAILEQRGKFINEHKQSVEGMVELLSAQLTEKDLALEEVRRSREAQESLPPIIPSSEECRELYAQVIARDNKIFELNNKIFELEKNIMDYEESIREKESVLEARTRAVALIKEDLGHKHSTALRQLEEARKEVVELKSTLSQREEQLKEEKKILVDTVASKEQKLAQLEAIRFDLCTRNAELQHKIVALQTKSHEVLSQGLPQDKDRIQELELKIEEVETAASSEIEMLKKKLEENNKLLTKTKVAYSKKLKNLEQKLQETHNVQDLEQKIAVLEEEKGNLQLLLVDFEEIKASEAMLQQQVNGLEKATLEQKSSLESQTLVINKLEETNSQTFNELQQLRASEAELQTELEAAKTMVQESEHAAVRANMKTVELEERLEQAEKAYQELTAEVESLLAQKETVDSSKHLQDVIDVAERDKSYYQEEVQSLREQLKAQEAISIESSEALLHAQQTLALKSTEHEAEIESLQAQISAKEERVSQLEEKIAELSDESQRSLAQLNETMMEAHHAQEALVKAESFASQEESRVSLAEEKIHALENQIGELQSALAQLKQLQEHESIARSHAQEEILQLRAKLNESAIQLESAAGIMSTLENLRREHENLQKKYQDETTQLKLKLDQAEDEVSAASSQVEKNHKDHQLAMEGWNNEMKFLKEHVNGLEEANNELHEQIDNLSLEKERIESELWSAQEELGNTKDALMKSQEDTLNESKAETDSLNQRIHELANQLVELQGRISNQSLEIENYRSSNATLNEELASYQLEKSAYNQAIDELRTKLQTLEGILKSSHDEKEHLSKYNEDLQSRLVSFQNQQSSMEGMNNHIAEVNNELERLRWALGERDQTLQMMGQQVSNYESQCRELSANVKDLEGSLAVSNQGKEQLEFHLKESQNLILKIQSDQENKEDQIRLRLSELESINVNLQNCLEQQKKDQEEVESSLKAQVEKLIEELNEAQSNKSAVVPDEISWGDDPWKESAHHQAPMDNSNNVLVVELQKQLQEAETAQAKLAEELKASQVRCGKALKQLKMVREQKKPASDLDKVMEDELQSRILSLQKELSEVQAERTSLVAKTETLKDANDRLTESKKLQLLEIERLKVERLALEQEAADWSQDDRVETLERQLQEVYMRCKELEEHIAGDEESEAESIILQENLVKSREKCSELERLRKQDEERLALLEEQLKKASENYESLRRSKEEVPEHSTPVEMAPVSALPVKVEIATMTEEINLTEKSVDTEEHVEVPQSALPRDETENISESVPRISNDVEKMKSELLMQQQERDALSALVAQLRGALEAKSQELALRGTDANLKAELDSALYFLHQRDVRCDELTLELMALMEERDALQMRLSSALRVNANQAEKLKEVGGQPEELQLKLHELHSVGHKRDVTLRGEQEMRHSEQQAALLPSPNLHYTPQQRVLQLEDPQQQQGSSGLLGWLWGY
ncbi:protein lava lamp-like isoform X2 [Neocloeon triangulifer]|uniref:protein lava lamp-like isoform X2 n=1 Tax=Neocloeon triangulifer TaxID=2078957 RepID=UPI00286EC128|nr:protein lava lamp-like isoform X2 [Neocloeon triangulifer]